MPKSGDDYLRSLRDGRSVFLNGRQLESVPDHDGFRHASRSIARLYDFQGDPENVERMTFATPKGDRVSRMWQLPTSYRELVERREALTSWAELHQGFMGRSPDHVGSTISAMYMGLDVYGKHTGGRRDAVRDYYEYARDNRERF